MGWAPRTSPLRTGSWRAGCQAAPGGAWRRPAGAPSSGGRPAKLSVHGARRARPGGRGPARPHPSRTFRAGLRTKEGPHAPTLLGPSGRFKNQIDARPRLTGVKKQSNLYAQRSPEAGPEEMRRAGSLHGPGRGASGGLCDGPTGHATGRLPCGALSRVARPGHSADQDIHFLLSGGRMVSVSSLWDSK